MCCAPDLAVTSAVLFSSVPQWAEIALPVAPAAVPHKALHTDAAEMSGRKNWGGNDGAAISKVMATLLIRSA